MFKFDIIGDEGHRKSMYLNRHIRVSMFFEIVVGSYVGESWATKTIEGSYSKFGNSLPTSIVEVHAKYRCCNEVGVCARDEKPTQVFGGKLKKIDTKRRTLFTLVFSKVRSCHL